MRRYHFDIALFKQSLIQTVAVIGFVANKLIRSISGKAAGLHQPISLRGAKRFPCERLQEYQKRLRLP
jgi:hypothetical protein